MFNLYTFDPIWDNDPAAATLDKLDTEADFEAWLDAANADASED